MIETGEVTEVLKGYADNTFDAVFCDPPYGLKFMSKKWDYDVPSVALWEQVLRVCKPGAALLAFGGTRTYHRMVVNIEDAGFEIRDQIAWMYGSGFPKSHDVSKAIDKAAGATREVVGTRSSYRPSANAVRDPTGFQDRSDGSVTSPATDTARRWSGYGTALKPAYEPLVLARKPVEGTVAANVQKWGCGALAIDATRVGSEEITINRFTDGMKPFGEGAGHPYESSTVTGRWPANVILDEEAGKILDAQSGFTKSSDAPRNNNGYQGLTKGSAFKEGPRVGLSVHSDSGGASRFFYCAKANKKDRGAGNTHPTVKPSSLCTYLARLIMPPTGGKILVPFSGSGSEVLGCMKAGWTDVTGIEMDPEYVKIAMERINAFGQG